MLEGFKFRQKLTISGSSGAGSNYQILLKIGESDGAANFDFHLNGKSENFPEAANDGGDLRFTTEDGETLLSFYVVQVTGSGPNRTAQVRIKVAADLGTEKEIYCYYGKSDATNASNGANTFLFFEDFNSYNDGALNGQGDWSGDTQFTIQATEVFEGSKAAKVTDGPTNTIIGIGKTIPNIGNNSYAVESFRRAAQTNKITGYLRQRQSEEVGGAEASALANENVQHQGNTSANDGQYTANNWFKVTTEVRENGNGRVYKEGETPTAWMARTTTNNVAFIDMLSFSGGTLQAWWDTIMIRKFIETEPSFSSTSGPESIPWQDRIIKNVNDEEGDPEDPFTIYKEDIESIRGRLDRLEE